MRDQMEGGRGGEGSVMGKTLPILQRKGRDSGGWGWGEGEEGGRETERERDSLHVLLSMCLVNLDRNA